MCGCQYGKSIYLSLVDSSLNGSLVFLFPALAVSSSFVILLLVDVYLF